MSALTALLGGQAAAPQPTQTSDDGDANAGGLDMSALLGGGSSSSAPSSGGLAGMLGALGGGSSSSEEETEGAENAMIAKLLGKM